MFTPSSYYTSINPPRHRTTSNVSQVLEGEGTRLGASAESLLPSERPRHKPPGQRVPEGHRGGDSSSHLGSGDRPSSALSNEALRSVEDLTPSFYKAQSLPCPLGRRPGEEKAKMTPRQAPYDKTQSADISNFVKAADGQRPKLSGSFTAEAKAAGRVPRTSGATVKNETRKKKKRQQNVPEQYIADVGSIRSAISMPGAVPVVRDTLMPNQHPSPPVITQTPLTIRDVVREYCMYCTSVAPVPGMLTLTPYSLTFEPDPRTQIVQELGIGKFQVYVDINDVEACASIMLPGGPLMTRYFGFPVGAHDHKTPPGTESPSPRQPVPGFFQAVVRRNLMRLLRHLKDAGTASINRRKDSAPAYTEVRSSEGSGTSDSHHRWRTMSLSYEGREKDSSDLPTKFLSYSDRTAEERWAGDTAAEPEDLVTESAMSMILFWLPDSAAVKSLTRKAIDLIDIRDTARAALARPAGMRRTACAEEHLDTISSGTSVETLPPVTLTYIPHDSSETFEMFLLSPRAQHNLLAAARRRLTRQGSGSAAGGDDDLLTPTALSCAYRETVSGISLESDEEYDGSPHSSFHPLLRAPSLDVLEGVATLMTNRVAAQLFPYLPATLAIKTWRLLFCTQLDGLSYLTFFRKLKNAGPALFLISDLGGMLFGAFCSVDVRESSRYYGTGECFVFTFKAFKEQKLPGEKWSDISVYNWSSKNSYFVFSDSKTIAFGGGGAYAIAVDSNFLQGYSQPCETYGNPCLSSTADFIVRHFQVWGFADP